VVVEEIPSEMFGDGDNSGVRRSSEKDRGTGFGGGSARIIVIRSIGGGIIIGGDVVVVVASVGTVVDGGGGGVVVVVVEVVVVVVVVEVVVVVVGKEQVLKSPCRSVKLSFTASEVVLKSEWQIMGLPVDKKKRYLSTRNLFFLLYSM